jgi:deoxyribodipyrimidine photolyase
MRDIKDILRELHNSLQSNSFDVNTSAINKTSDGFSMTMQDKKTTIITSKLFSISPSIFFDEKSKSGFIEAREYKMIFKIMNELKKYNMFWYYDYTSKSDNSDSKAINALRRYGILIKTSNNALHIVNPLMISYGSPLQVFMRSISKLDENKFRLNDDLLIHLDDIKYKKDFSEIFDLG